MAVHCYYLFAQLLLVWEEGLKRLTRSLSLTVTARKCIQRWLAGWIARLEKCKISLEYGPKLRQKCELFYKFQNCLYKKRQKYTSKWYSSPQNCKHFPPKVKISLEWDYQIPHFLSRTHITHPHTASSLYVFRVHYVDWQFDCQSVALPSVCRWRMSYVKSPQQTLSMPKAANFFLLTSRLILPDHVSLRLYLLPALWIV